MPEPTSPRRDVPILPPGQPIVRPGPPASSSGTSYGAPPGGWLRGGPPSGRPPSPPPPWPAPGRPVGGSVPRPVRWSFVLWIVDAVFASLCAIATTYVAGYLVTEQADALSNWWGVDLSALSHTAVYAVLYQVRAAVVGVATTAFLFFGALVLIALVMRSGRNWARWLLGLAGVGTVVLTLVQLAGTAFVLAASRAGAVIGLLSLAHIALVVAAITFMFSRDAKPWFECEERRTRR